MALPLFIDQTTTTVLLRIRFFKCDVSHDLVPFVQF